MPTNTTHGTKVVHFILDGFEHVFFSLESFCEEVRISVLTMSVSKMSLFNLKQEPWDE